MKLIVGLGNPGRKYAATRHNVGFEVVRETARRMAPGEPRIKFKGEIWETRIADHAALLLLPQTYMNLSGASVQMARDFYKLSEEDILVTCDDFNLPLARLRFRPGGSAGGQKGLADILRCLGTQQIARLRIGIDPPPPRWDLADYVLSRFRQDELEAIQAAVVRASEAVVDWVEQGIEFCMNRYNASPAS